MIQNISIATQSNKPKVLLVYFDVVIPQFNGSGKEEESLIYKWSAYVPIFELKTKDVSAYLEENNERFMNEVEAKELLWEASPKEKEIEDEEGNPIIVPMDKSEVVFPDMLTEAQEARLELEDRDEEGLDLRVLEDVVNALSEIPEVYNQLPQEAKDRIIARQTIRAKMA